MIARSVPLLLLLIPASLRGQATDIQMFFDLLRSDPEQAAVAEQAILDGWDDSQAAMLVDLHRLGIGILKTLSESGTLLEQPETPSEISPCEAGNWIGHGHSGIRPWSTSESGPVGARRRPDSCP